MGMEMSCYQYLFIPIIQVNQPSFQVINSDDKDSSSYSYNVIDAVTKPTQFSLSHNQIIGPWMELTLISKGDVARILSSEDPALKRKICKVESKIRTRECPEPGFSQSYTVFPYRATVRYQSAVDGGDRVIFERVRLGKWRMRSSTIHINGERLCYSIPH